MENQNGRNKLGIHWKPDLTIGNLLTLTTVAFSTIGSFYGIKYNITAAADDRAGLHHTIEEIQADRKTTKDAVFKLLQADHDTNEVQNNRLENFGDRVKQLLDITLEQGKQIHEQSKQIANMNADLVLLKYILMKDGKQLPPLQGEGNAK